ncbi:MAG: nucleotidyltransferase domain-containing protein [Bdellovibrionales bacterium]|nr:nucleotidyltransferase domain-containing protein [Bdellovibrionales bacterium]
MKFGLTQEQYKYILETVVLPLESNEAIVWCFGSRARGDYKKFSDLDLMVESKKDQSVLMAKIRETLENSNFPLKVDLVDKNEFAISYLENFNKEKIRFKKVAD